MGNICRWCPEGLTASSFCRFEFDVSLQEVQTRKLDVSVKNNKMFYTRERKDIGMVGALGSMRLSTSSTAWGNIVSHSALVHRFWSISQRWMLPKASRNGTDSRNSCCTHFIQTPHPSKVLRVHLRWSGFGQQPNVHTISQRCHLTGNHTSTLIFALLR